MTFVLTEQAAAAVDSYVDRLQTDVVAQKDVILNDQKYTVFAYEDDPTTGFHATAYRNKETKEIIIAYRGTDVDYKHHMRTMVQDAYVDFTMVKGNINVQEAEARAFTQRVIDSAQRHGISKDQITVAGHSLGGTLAEIEASRFGLRGVTFNAYGPVGL